MTPERLTAHILTLKHATVPGNEKKAHRDGRVSKVREAAASATALLLDARSGRCKSSGGQPVVVGALQTNCRAKHGARGLEPSCLQLAAFLT